MVCLDVGAYSKGVLFDKGVLIFFFCSSKCILRNEKQDVEGQDHLSNAKRRGESGVPAEWRPSYFSVDSETATASKYIEGDQFVEGYSSVSSDMGEMAVTNLHPTGSEVDVQHRSGISRTPGPSRFQTTMIDAIRIEGEGGLIHGVPFYPSHISDRTTPKASRRETARGYTKIDSKSFGDDTKR